MQRKSILAILLATALLTGCLSACGSAAESSPSTVPAAPSASEEAPVPSEASAPAPEPAQAQDSAEAAASVPEAEPVEPEAESVEDLAPDTDYTQIYPLFDQPETFTIWVANSPDLSSVIDDFSDFLVIEEMEKLTNLHWDANLVSFTASEETFGLMLASQDYTDVINGAVAGYTGGGDSAIDDDVIIDIQEYIPECMPSLSIWMENYPELRKTMTSNNGHICGFPKMQDPFFKSVSSGMLRKDWLENLNLAVPTTFDEMHDVLTAFQSEKQASTPMQIGDPTGVQDELLAGYNISKTYYQVDGEVRFGAVQPEFKDYLTTMNQWYKESLLDPDFVIQPMSILLDYSNILGDQTGIWYTCNLTNISVLEQNANDPNFAALAFSDVSVSGERVHCAKVQSIFNPDAWSITTACDDPAAICKYVDYFYSREGVALCNFGVEGYTFEYDADGNRVFTDVILNNPDYSYSMALNIFTCDMQTQIPFIQDSRKETSNYTESQWESYYASGANADGEYMMPVAATMTAAESTEYSDIYSDIETYMDENISKFVTGDKPLEEFESFVATLKSMNIDRCVELQQAAYDRYMAK